MSAQPTTRPTLTYSLGASLTLAGLLVVNIGSGIAVLVLAANNKDTAIAWILSFLFGAAYVLLLVFGNSLLNKNQKVVDDLWNQLQADKEHPTDT